MRVEDVEKAVKLKAELDDTARLLEDIKDVALAGLTRVTFTAGHVSNTCLITTSEVSENALMHALEVLKTRLETKYNELHAQITAL